MDTRELFDCYARARSGDAEARNRLFAELLRSLTARLHARLPGHLRSKVETQDLVQSGLLELMKNLHRYEDRGPAAFVGLAHTFAERKFCEVLDRYRAQKRAPGREVAIGEGSDASGPHVLAPDPGPASAAESHEMAEGVRASLEELPDYLHAIVLSEIEGATLAEIARKQGRAEATIRGLKAKAIHLLRALLHRKASRHSSVISRPETPGTKSFRARDV